MVYVDVIYPEPSLNVVKCGHRWYVARVFIPKLKVLMEAVFCIQPNFKTVSALGIISDQTVSPPVCLAVILPWCFVWYELCYRCLSYTQFTANGSFRWHIICFPVTYLPAFIMTIFLRCGYVLKTTPHHNKAQTMCIIHGASSGLSMTDSSSLNHDNTEHGLICHPLSITWVISTVFIKQTNKFFTNCIQLCYHWS